MARIGIYVACTAAGPAQDPRTLLRTPISTGRIQELYAAYLQRFERLHCPLIWWMPMGYRECAIRDQAGNPARRTDWRGLTDIDYDIWELWVRAQIGAAPGWSDIGAYMGTPWLELASNTPDAGELKREERVYDFVQSSFGTRNGGPLMVADALFGCTAANPEREAMTEAHWNRIARLQSRGLRIFGEGWPRAQHASRGIPGFWENMQNTIDKRAVPARAAYDDQGTKAMRILQVERPPAGLALGTPLETWAEDVCRWEGGKWDLILFEGTLGAWSRAKQLADVLVEAAANPITDDQTAGTP